jgi:hypothetical protein
MSRRVLAVVLVMFVVAAGTTAGVLTTKTSGTSTVAAPTPLTSQASTSTSPPSPPTIRLVLDPVDIDLASMLEVQGADAVAVPWISPEGTDPYQYLSNDEQVELYETMVACFPGRETNPSLDDLFRARLECWDPFAIEASSRVPDPTDLFAAIYAMNVSRPDVYTVCHNGSHKIGKITLDRAVAKHGLDEAVLQHLISAGRTSCMGGLVHGVLDAVGFMTSEVEVFAKVIRACMNSSEDAVGYCGDAVGHAAWDAFYDIDKAAEACSHFPTQMSRFECSEGVLMRMYQRNEALDTDWYNGSIELEEVPRWNREVAELCRQWPSTPFPAAPGENPQLGCFSGSIYTMFQPLYHLLKQGQGDHTEVFDEMSLVLDLIIETCQSYGPGGEEVCLFRLGSFVPHAVLFDLEASILLCQRLPASSYVDDCVENSEIRIANALSGN